IGETNLIDCVVERDTGAEVVVAFPNGTKGELRHHGSSRLGTGERALAVLRPEYLELCEPDQAPFVGSVSQTVFLGAYCRHDVELESGDVIRVNGDPDSAPQNGALQGVSI